MQAHAATNALDDPNAPQQFQACDGYGAPNQNGDGITQMATGFLGMFVPAPTSGTTSMTLPAFSQQGINACSAALNNQARLLPAYHVRRASLLRARAIHRFSAGDKAGARTDLDASDAEGALAADPLYERSMGLGNRLLHSYFALQDGEQDRVLVQAREAARLRPYAEQVQEVANLLTLNASHDGDAYFAALDAQATFSPRLRPLVMMQAMDRLDWAKVIATRAQIDLTPPEEWQGNFALQNYDLVLARPFFEAFRLDGITVFALAAAGRQAESQQLLEDMAKRLEPLGADLPNRPDGSRPPRLQRNVHTILRNALGGLQLSLARTRSDLAMLAMARIGDANGLLAATKTAKIPEGGRGLQILQSLHDATFGPAKEAMSKQLTSSKVRLRLQRNQAPLTLADLYEAVPAPETPKRLPRYTSAKGILGLDSDSGFLVGSDGPVTKVGFGGAFAPAAVVEEMALLKAADLTLAAGKDRFILLDKKITARTMQQVSIYGGWKLPSGYSANLRIVSYGAEGPPKGYEAYATRAIMAREVADALGAAYKVNLAVAPS